MWSYRSASQEQLVVWKVSEEKARNASIALTAIAASFGITNVAIEPDSTASQVVIWAYSDLLEGAIACQSTESSFN